MKIKHTYRTPDYRVAMEKFNKFKAEGSPYLIYDYTTKDYIIEITQEVSSNTDLMRNILHHLSNNDDLADEERDALAFADSAIKTLTDMGIIEQ